MSIVKYESGLSNFLVIFVKDNNRFYKTFDKSEDAKTFCDKMFEEGNNCYIFDVSDTYDRIYKREH